MGFVGLFELFGLIVVVRVYGWVFGVLLVFRCFVTVGCYGLWVLCWVVGCLFGVWVCLWLVVIVASIYGFGYYNVLCWVCLLFVCGMIGVVDMWFWLWVCLLVFDCWCFDLFVVLVGWWVVCFNGF